MAQPNGGRAADNVIATDGDDRIAGCPGGGTGDDLVLDGPGNDTLVSLSWGGEPVPAARSPTSNRPCPTPSSATGATSTSSAGSSTRPATPSPPRPTASANRSTSTSSPAPFQGLDPNARSSSVRVFLPNVLLSIMNIVRRSRSDRSRLNAIPDNVRTSEHRYRSTPSVMLFGDGSDRRLRLPPMTAIFPVPSATQTLESASDTSIPA